MIPPKVIKFRDFKKVFRSFGIVFKQGKNRGHKRNPHFLMVGKDRAKYPIPGFKNGDDVSRAYVNAARRRFRLWTTDGVSHDEFYGRLS